MNKEFRLSGCSAKEVLPKLLQLAKNFKQVCILTSNKYPATLNIEKGPEILAGFGALSCFEMNANSFSNLDEYLGNKKGKLLFTQMAYELKAQIHPSLANNKPSNISFPELVVFEPKHWFKLEGKDLICSSQEALNLIQSVTGLKTKQPQKIDLKPQLCKADYLEKINEIQDYIQRGDTYELTFCQQFIAQAKLEPEEVFLRLNESNASPFAAYYRYHSSYLLCASPERFLKKQGNKLYSQPIKGTMSRGANKAHDSDQMLRLKTSQKDQAENVMIVDLVRNDLSKLAQPKTVHVDELFGLYTFPKVHQLISTVSCDIQESTTLSSILKATFPMGSMTGAPKHKTMQLIEELEGFNRGLFSGSIGYIDEQGDFDFNVVIRSILYNAEKEYIACPVGGAITIASSPEREYQECLWKLSAQANALNAEIKL